jgi:hypothetical protein
MSDEDFTPTWIKLFLQLGFPTAVAILLLGALLGWLPSPLMQRLSNLEYLGWQNSAVLRAICYNLAGTAGEKYRCEPWKDRE